MSAEITLEQIKALKADYFKDLDLTCPSALIQDLYVVEGEQAEQLLKTVRMTEEHLNTAISVILNHLLGQDAVLSFRQPILAEQYLVLLTLLDLLAGINGVTYKLGLSRE